jgi:2-oxoglutarate dehydrogenase E2 component (dihydrolipoamide succinyltransferase)
MAVDVKVPAVGESVQEAMIHKWHKAAGDVVKRDDVLLELETDKATVEVTAEADGALAILRKEGDTVAIGEVIARIDPAGKGEGAGKTAAVPPPPGKAKDAAPTKAPTPAAAPAAKAATPAKTTIETPPLSPAVRRMVEEHAVDPGAVSASGKGGRLTKGDVVDYLEGKGNAPAPAAPAAKAPSAPGPVAKAPTPPAPGGRGEHREPMTMLRRRIAERLVQAQSQAALLTTFNEINMQATMDLRKQYKDGFKEKHGVGLGFMGFFVKAAVEALKQFPQINGWVDGNEVVFHDYFDVGVAVSTDRGLVVPVLRNAETMGVADVEKGILGFATRARDGKITVDELSGGTFTISNGGVFGSLLSTPIVNPPQSAILGLHKIQDRPIALNGQVVIRPMMYVALTYDHRLVDGREAVQFLVKIKEMIEDPARLLLGV